MYPSLEDLEEPEYYLEPAVEQVPAKETEPEPVKEGETESKVVAAEPELVKESKQTPVKGKKEEDTFYKNAY